MHEVPGHEGGIAVGEVVFGAAGARIEIGGTGTGLTQPGGVGLRRDDKTEMLFFSMIAREMAISPSVWDISGDRLRVQFRKRAFRSEKSVVFDSH